MLRKYIQHACGQVLGSDAVSSEASIDHVCAISEVLDRMDLTYNPDTAPEVLALIGRAPSREQMAADPRSLRSLSPPRRPLQLKEALSPPMARICLSVAFPRRLVPVAAQEPVSQPCARRDHGA